MQFRVASMKSDRAALLAVAIVSALLLVGHSYNLDALVPTVVDSGISSSSLFGFSLAQHQFSDGRKM